MKSLLAIQTTVHSTYQGRWMYHQCVPGVLAPTIESIWEVRGTITHTRERVFPSARVDIIINLGPSQRLLDGRLSERIDRASISGFQHRPLVTNQRPISARSRR